MDIRACTVEDIDLLHDISRETFADTFLPYNTYENVEKYMAKAYSKDQLISELNHPETFTYFALVDDQVAGFLKINFKSSQTEKNYPHSMEVHRIYVRQAFKRQGVGKALMNWAEKKAREAQVDYIWLGVWEHNDAALAFYKSMGFQPFETHVFKMGDKTQKDFVLRKDIA